MHVLRGKSPPFSFRGGCSLCSPVESEDASNVLAGCTLRDASCAGKKPTDLANVVVPYRSAEEGEAVALKLAPCCLTNRSDVSGCCSVHGGGYAESTEEDAKLLDVC